MMLPHLAARLYGVPLLLHRSKLDTILAVLGQRVMQPATGLPPWSKPAPEKLEAPSGIAVLEIHGTLVRRTHGLDAESGLASYSAIEEALDAALSDTSIEGIFLDVDSAGGEAGGVFDLADRIYAVRQQKPIWAIANDMAFSAAYAIASAAERVWVTRTGGVGSIGVIAMHVDQSVKDSQDGLKFTPIYAGAHKNDLNPHAPLSVDALDGLQGEVDRLHEIFVSSVARNRQCSVDAVRQTEASLFHGHEALASGLADAVGTRSEALQQFSAHLISRKSMRPGQATNFSQPQEVAMSEDIHQSPVAKTGDTTLSTQTADPLTYTQALEVVHLCSIAGCTDRIAAFLESGMPPDQVRRSLLAAKANTSPEIMSWLDGTEQATQASHSAENLVLSAVKRMTNPQSISR